MTGEVKAMTPTQAANALGLSRERVRQLADEGKLRHERTPLGRLLNRDDVERLVRERRGARPTGTPPA